MPSSAQPGRSPDTEPFRLRGTNFNHVVLHILDPRPDAVLPALGRLIHRAPAFLRNAPVVLGLSDLDAAVEIAFEELIAGVRRLHLFPIGVVGGTRAQQAAAAAAGLPVLSRQGAKGEDVDLSVPQATEPTSAAPAVEAPAVEASAVEESAPEPTALSGKTLLVTAPVRSGSRVYAPGADLVVTATVNAGAEVIADGNVHIYGALRGRAIAGAAGDERARIFALSFDPELVAIAGLYRVREDLDSSLIGHGAQLQLDGERIRIEPLM